METTELLQTVISKILSYSGIYVAESQKPALDHHIQKKSAERGISAEEFCAKLEPKTPDFDEIINLITINETYFFREEKQFDFLKEEIFPKYAGKSLTLWTCCCSTGEEPISLLALALSMNVKLTIYASDIDDNALAMLRRGRYSLYSLRRDGNKYHGLLEPYSTKTETEIIFKKDFLNNIHAFKFNLIRDTELPFFEQADIIFMRNVFIYFDKPTRIAVTKKVSERLKTDGLMFFSMNEIGSIDKTIIPEYLYKTNHGVVYYFRRGKMPEKTGAAERLAARRAEDAAAAREAERQEKLRREIAKYKTIKEQAAATAHPAGGTTATFSGAAPQTQNSTVNLKLLYDQICGEINRRDFVKARTIARAIGGEDYKRYSFFMQGYVEYYADNRSAAEMFFACAETASQDFWPAYFYHGMVLRDLGKTERAAYCFNRCKELLKEFGSNNPYDFALDSFSPSYIYSLCDTFQGGHDGN